MSMLINVLEFLLFTVVVKGIIAHSIAEYLVKYAKKLVNSNPRFKSIWLEELAKARQTS